jgi:predicted deacylase
LNEETKTLFNTKIIIKNSGQPGKKVLIMAGVHGNEVCGIKALDELIPKIVPIKGKVIFVYANLEAIKQNKRYVETNLNRCFLKNQPDDIKETLEGKTAKEIIPFLEEADILLDLHSSKTSANKSYLICEKHCQEYFSVLNPKNIISGIDKTHPGGSDGFMGKKIGICIECGLHDSQDSIENAKNAIFNILKKAEVVEGNTKSFLPKKIFLAKYIYKSKNGPFILSRNFGDFEEFKEKTIVGKDGVKEVYAKAGDVIMFADEPKKIGGECFMILQKE